MTRRPLSRQLLLLQMLLVALMVLALGTISVVQADQTFRVREQRRLLAAAESVASEAVVRDGLVLRRTRTAAAKRLEGVRAASGASYVALVEDDGDVLATSVPDEPVPLRPDVRRGASWAGTGQRYDRKEIEAQVAVLAARPYPRSGIRAGDVLGTLVLGRFYPSRLEVLRAAIPNALVYFAIAGAIGAVGSLLIARRVKRQTLGLEPREITALVEQREAMLHGVREGVLGVDLTGRVAFSNDHAALLLGLEPPLARRDIAGLDLPAELGRVLSGEEPAADHVVALGDRLLVLNTQPIAVRGRQTGWVTSMRDRTELLGLEQELAAAQAGTDTLRAQVHEFRNRLHVIAGMAELGRVEQVRDFVQTITHDLDDRVGRVTERIADSAVAALLIAKASRASERGIAFVLTDDSRLEEQATSLSADLVTVVGNLVDNAIEAVGSGGRITVDVRQHGPRIVVEVSDTGAGIAEADLGRVFERGWTTKAGPDARAHGFGLALTRMACHRHGGSVSVVPGDGACLRAELLVGQGGEK